MMNKKQLLFLPLLAAYCLPFTSCDWKKQQGAANEQDSLEVNRPPAYCTVEFEDSASYLHASAYQKIEVDFPAEEDTTIVSQQVLEWLCEEVRNRCFPNFGEATEDSAETQEPCSITFAEDYVRDHGRKGLQHMVDDMKEMAEEGFDASFSNQLSISLTEETSNYLTFSMGHEVYTGGAHGGFYTEGRTFLKSNGQQFGWQCFDKEKRAELVELMKKGLMDYFSEGTDQTISTDSALFEQLLLFDNPDTPENELEFGLPLPVTEPWLTKEGVCFIYQQYEVAPYAAGCPWIVLPRKVVKNFLTPAGRAFLN